MMLALCTLGFLIALSTQTFAETGTVRVFVVEPQKREVPTPMWSVVDDIERPSRVVKWLSAGEEVLILQSLKLFDPPNLYLLIRDSTGNRGWVRERDIVRGKDPPRHKE
ncbi:MAG: hypothetical protein U1B94_07455 [candidate division NC10 bacterium]|nr:hypothetical protein [candidate division NC10 bacterium]